ncbi:hypothetical protein [Borreliella americana]|uniref:hypothetical protein n=1 Tax=Borreliella americana TaxID=478807 RepID=UPI001E39986D|nr:hypothetical protein [Borreliella americana]MCD2332395.1 hypothetical protein [Borreliella americana]
MLCNLNGGTFTREQETKIKEIVANKQNEKSKRLIEAAGNNASNESLLGMTIKVKNKIIPKQTKKNISLRA